MIKTVALVGATGAVGSIVRQLLEERNFPAPQFKFLASARSAGQSLSFRGEEQVVEELRPEAFDGVDLVIASTPDDVARDCLPWAVERGATVVDESGAWRMDSDVPLVVPEVNPEAIQNHQGIIASPNCSTIQMVVAMKPLHSAGTIRRVVVSTYQATSGAGVSGQKELTEGTQASLAGEDYDYGTFAHPIAFNLIPQIGSEKHQGYTSEEMKMVWETHKIFNDESINICPTCVRVPVTNCHSESILIETEEKITVPQAQQLFCRGTWNLACRQLGTGTIPNATGLLRPGPCFHRSYSRRLVLTQWTRVLVCE